MVKFFRQLKAELKELTSERSFQARLDNRMKAFLASFIFLEFGHALIDLLIFSHISPDYSLSQLILFPLFSALVAASVGYIVEPVIERVFFTKKQAGQKSISIIWLFALGFTFFFVMYFLAGFYTIKTGEGAVVTEYNGQKDVITESGFHYRLAGVTNIERFDIRDNILDKKLTSISTNDGKIVNVEIVMPYRIKDLSKFAVTTVNPIDQLTALIQSSITKEIQGSSIDNLNVRSREIEDNTKTQVSQIAESLGIEVKDLKITISEPNDVLSARSQAEANLIAAKSQADTTTRAAQSQADANKILAEGKIAEAESLRNATQIQLDAIRGLSADELDYLLKTRLYDSLKGNNNAVYVVPSQTPVLVQGK